VVNLKGELSVFNSEIQENEMKKSPLAGGPLDDPDVSGTMATLSTGRGP
jgi:hypothetical protein